MKKRISRLICILAIAVGLLGASIDPPAQAAPSSPKKVLQAKRKVAKKKAPKKKKASKKASRKKARKVCRRVKRRRVCKVVPVLPPTPEQAIAVAAPQVAPVAPPPAAPAPPAPAVPPPPPPPAPAPVTVPACSGTAVSVGTDIQQALTASAEGTSFCLKPGVHRLTKSLQPRNSQKINGEKGAVLSGSRLVSATEATVEGVHWVLTGQSQQLPAFSMPPGYGACRPRSTHSQNYSGCIYPDQLFLDDVALWQ